MKKHVWANMVLLFGLIILLVSDVFAQEGLKVDANGNVGIGVLNPSTKLEISQNSAIKIGQAYLSSGGNRVNLANNEWYDGSAWQAYGDGALIQLVDQNTQFYRHANGTHSHSMIINQLGNVGIGTTGPGAKLHVNDGNFFLTHSSDANRIMIQSGFDTHYGYIEWRKKTGGTRGAFLGWGLPGSYIDFRLEDGNDLAINGGNVGIGTYAPVYKLDVIGAVRCTSLTQTSDVRLKEDVAPIRNALDRVARLRGVSFHWSDNTSNEKSLRIGVIGQEVEKVFPEAVSTDGEGYKSVAYAKLVAPMIEAIKELKANNETLSRAVQNLHVENKNLRKRIEAIETGRRFQSHFAAME